MKQPVSSLENVAARDAIDASGVVGSGGGDRAELLAGAITPEAFLSRQVDRALEHLVGKLSTERLDHMREVLMSQFSQDPVLASLAARATSRS